MMKYIYIIFITTILCIDISLEKNSLNGSEIESHNSAINYSNNSYSLLHDYINPAEYITGPGDVFLFNMVTSSRSVNLELIVSPLGTILIPIVGVVDVKDKSINYVYEAIIKKCKEKYVDANVYLELIKTRFLKVLVTGDFNKSGMFSVSSTDRVSDLIESILRLESQSPLSNKNSPIHQYLPDFPRNIFLNKEIDLFRNDSLINIDLFSYYTDGNFSYNPMLREGDVINIKNSNKISILGEVENPIRIDKTDNMKYNDLINKAGLLNINIDKTIINIINYKFLTKFSKNEINRINRIDQRYRSDVDDSFLNSRLKTNYGLFSINNENDLLKFLSLEPVSGDIIIIQNKSDYVEIIGGVNVPGLYQYNKSFNLDNYIKKAGGFNKIAKTKNMYVISSTNGVRTIVEKKYSPNRGDIIFIEEKPSFKSWERFAESIKLVGTLATMSLVIYNIWNDSNE